MILTPILTIPLADVPLLTFLFQALQGAVGDIPSHMTWDIFLSGKKENPPSLRRVRSWAAGL